METLFRIVLLSLSINKLHPEESKRNMADGRIRCELFKAKICKDCQELMINLELYVSLKTEIRIRKATITRCDLTPRFFCIDDTLLREFESDKI